MLTHNPTQTRTGAKRLLLVTAVAVIFGAVAALVSSTTFGLFSGSSSSSTSSLTAGTVTQSTDLTGACSVSNLLPNGAANNCGTLKATYTGNVRAFLGLDVLIETQAGSGGTKLYNPSDASHALSVTISSTSPTVAAYTLPATATTCPVSPAPPAGTTCYELDNDLVSTTPFTNSSGQVTFATSVSIPTTSPTGYQGGAAQIYLTVHAAQSGNNAATACSAGAQCTAVNWH